MEMRTTKAFFLGLGAALFVERALTRHRRRDNRSAAVDDVTIEHRVLGDALPAAGVDPDEVDVDVRDGVVSLNGSVTGTERADALVQKVAEVPGVRDVAAMIRVSDRRAA
jgi:osmotically-inducible protein OsmY